MKASLARQTATVALAALTIAGTGGLTAGAASALTGKDIEGSVQHVTSPSTQPGSLGQAENAANMSIVGSVVLPYLGYCWGTLGSTRVLPEGCTF